MITVILESCNTLQVMNKDNKDKHRTAFREKSQVSPTGHRPSLEQFGSMKIEFLQDNRVNPKEWSVSISTSYNMAQN